MTRILFTLFLVLLPMTSFAQDDKSRLVRFLEDTLSTSGRQITIEGFSGALSSRAKVAKLVIADDQGPWLTIIDAVLDWNRLAVLRGNIEITELSAAEILLPRLPGGGGSNAPSPEASVIKLPELPLSVQIESIKADRVVLGESILKQPVEMSVAGSLSLADGEGKADLQIKRIDAKQGEFLLKAGYSNTTRILALDLNVNEGPDGIVANLAQIPGAPALSLSVTGNDPLDNFTAQIALKSEGQDRLAGTVALTTVAEPGAAPDPGGTSAQGQNPAPSGAPATTYQRITADLKGDIAPLFAPQYQPFFGPDISLALKMRRFDDGRVLVEDLALKAASLRVNGDLELATDGLPERFLLDVRLADPDGNTVRLPTAGKETLLRKVDINASFDRAKGERWTLLGTVEGLFRPDISFERLRLDGGGVIQRGSVKQATANLTAAVTGLSSNNTDLAAALGPKLDLTTDLTWREGAPVQFSKLELATQGLQLAAAGALGGPKGTFNFDGDISADVQDLSRLSGLAGRPLQGSLRSTVKGSIGLVGGAFDITADATGKDLGIGIEQVDQLLVGDSTLRLSAKRDTQGTELRGFRVETAALNAAAQGRVATGDSDLNFSASLDDLARFVPSVPGAVSVTGTAVQVLDQWKIDVNADAPAASSAAVSLNWPIEGQPSATVTARIGEVQKFVPGLEGAANVQAEARREGETWRVDFDADAPRQITAKGTLSLPPGGAPQAELTARIAEVQEFVPQLEGPATVTAKTRQEGDTLLVDFTADAPKGITATGLARLPKLGGPSATLTAELADVATFVPGVPALQGPATLRIDAAQTNATWRADFTADAPQDITAKGRVTLPSGGQIEARLSADIPRLQAFVPMLEGPASLTAQTRQDGETLLVDFTADAPKGLTAQGTALLPKGGLPSVKATAKLPDLSQFVPGVAALAGPATVRIDAAQTDSGLAVSFDADAPQDITAKGRVTLPAGGVPDAQVTVEIPRTETIVSLLEGPSTLKLTAKPGTGEDARTLLADLTLDAPKGLSARASARLPEGGALSATADIDVVDVAALAPGVQGFTGPAKVHLAAARTGQDWAVTFNADAPKGITASGEATLSADAPPVVNFTAEVPQLELFVPQLKGPASLSATTRQEGETVLIEFKARAPEGITADGLATFPPDGATTATLDARIADVATFAPGIDGFSGPATVALDARKTGAEWNIDFDAKAPADITASGTATLPPTGGPTVDFNAKVPRLETFVPGFEGPVTLSAAARQNGDTWALDFTADAPKGITAQGQVRLPPQGGPQADVTARLADMAVFVPGFDGPAIVKAQARKDAASWLVDFTTDAPKSITASGTVTLPPQGGPRADINARIADLAVLVPGFSGPATATAQARQDLGAWVVDFTADAPRGISASGQARLPGDGGPQARVTLRAAQLSVFVPGLDGPATVEATARQQDQTWFVDFTADGPQGLTAKGLVELPPGQGPRLSVDTRIASVSGLLPGVNGPASLSARASQNGNDWTVEFSGAAPGSTTLSGRLTVPQGGALAVDANVRVGNLGAFVPQVGGSVSVQAQVRQQAGGYAISATSTGPGGAALRVDGTLAGSVGNAALTLSGTAPLALADPFLAPRSIAGTAQFDLRLNGPLALSSLSGQISTANARVSLPSLRNAITNINATIALSGGRAQIALRAGVDSGGSFTVNGPLSLSAPFDADLAVVLDNVVVTDPKLYESSVAGRLTLRGPITGGGLLSGQLDVGPTEIRVPSTGLGGSDPIPDVAHVAEPADVKATRARAGLLGDAAQSGGGGAAGGQNASKPLRLDIRIVAPNRIFVRGRGLDAELGGRLSLTGTTANVVPQGQFDLIRGRLDILGQRLTLDEGSVQLQGDFIPAIRLVARTDTGEVVVSIVVSGQATEPRIQFLSDPQLPEDEVLSRLLFGRSISSISPLQAAQLASAVATLAGRGGNGIIANLRAQTGLDDLDVTTGADGSVGVRAGKYLSENVYTDVTVGSQGKSSINLNLDVSPSVTVKGRLGSDGNTGLGVFFERDY
ncbi:translocation/assembly module TamB domain-containing protein [Brevirhabdus sp.]|uniref:translocation/assembly module TamB domain-containing protein n=1 Tax=Brevirhabdus sp. TaxID=2004514 RepID=UPI004058ACCE